MASLTDSATMSGNADFISRVSEAVAVTAYNILTTEADDAEDHAQREALAELVVRDINSYSYAFTRMVVANPTIAAQAPDQESVPDGDILFVVNQIWVDFAPAPPPVPTP
jgi:hypothetical protein